MKLYVWILTAVLMSSAAMAVSIDEECQEYNFDYGVVKFEWKGSEYVPEEDPLFPFEVDIQDDAQEAEWKSNPRVSGVLVKAGTLYEVYEGGTSGKVYGIETENPQGKKIVRDISHVTFCMNNGKGGNGGPPHGVPEFSTGAVFLVVVMGSMGLMFLRKQ